MTQTILMKSPPKQVHNRHQSADTRDQFRASLQRVDTHTAAAGVAPSSKGASSSKKIEEQVPDFCQESPIHNRSSYSGNGCNNLDLSQSLKELTSGSIKEEESHCLKKLTRVLSQRIGEERNSKKYKRNQAALLIQVNANPQASSSAGMAGQGSKKVGQVFELQPCQLSQKQPNSAKSDFIVNEEEEEEEMGESNETTFTRSIVREGQQLEQQA